MKILTQTLTLSQEFLEYSDEEILDILNKSIVVHSEIGIRFARTEKKNQITIIGKEEEIIEKLPKEKPKKLPDIKLILDELENFKFDNENE